jgi:hypothetical protein
MADQNIHFEDLSGGDTGERADTSAILPFSAGEQVKAAVLNRPLENLRGRTEIIRGELEDLKYLIDTNIRWIITGGTNVGSAVGHSIPMVINRSPFTRGTFTISETAIVLQPINTPKIDKKASALYEFGSPPGHSSLTFTSSLYGYEQPKGGGANPLPRGSWQRIQWSSAPYATLGARHCTVTLEGNPVHILHITVSEGDGGNYTTVAELHAQLDATTDMLTFGFEEVVAAGDETDTINISGFSASDLDYVLLDTYDRELHYLTKTEIDAYFNAHGALADGDTLCITYPFLVDPDSPTTKGGRRQATPTSSTVTPGTPNTEVTSGQLFVSSTAPGLIPISIPLCKRVGYDLIFIDGTIFRSDEDIGVYFGSSGYTNYYLSATTVGSSGATNVGVAAHTALLGQSVDTLNLPSGTLQAVLEAIQLFINDKSSCDADETISQNWLLTSTWHFYEASAVGGTPLKLLWRSGLYGVAARLGDAQILWTTLSRYSFSKTGVSTDEVYYITVQGAYLEMSGGILKAHTSAIGAGTGTLTITIESAGGGGVGSNNVRGTYRRNSAASNTQYLVFPTLYPTVYESGALFSIDTYSIWGTIINFVATAVNVISTSFNIATPLVTITPSVDTNTVGYKKAIHVSPALISTSGVLGASGHSYFNRVLEGFAVIPADLVEQPAPGSGNYSAGHFSADTIRVMGGRAIVAGSIVTIPEIRILTGVVNNHRLTGTPLPAGPTNMKWYGLWLRSDGVLRVGPIPQYNLGIGVPGSTQYMLPAGYADATFDVHDYTLVNLVWSYQGNTAGTMYFAGIMHVGNNLWMYHQARHYSAGWGKYVEHRFYQQHVTTATAAEGASERSTAYDAINGIVDGLPGVPAAMTNVVLLGVRMSATLQVSGKHAGAYLLHNLGDDSVYSAAYVAPSVVSDPTTPVLNETYDVLFDTDPYSAVLWRRMLRSSDSADINADYDDTVLYPVGFPTPTDLTNYASSIVRIGYHYDLSAGDDFLFQMRTLGFMWDRYNVGGIMR